jgi:hypothetical protein
MSVIEWGRREALSSLSSVSVAFVVWPPTPHTHTHTQAPTVHKMPLDAVVVVVVADEDDEAAVSAGRARSGRNPPPLAQ